MKPIKSDLYVINFEEKYGNTSLQKVMISKHNDIEIIQSVLAGEYNKDSIVISKSQYESLFAPLFKEITKLNQEVSDFNNNSNNF